MWGNTAPKEAPKVYTAPKKPYVIQGGKGNPNYKPQDKPKPVPPPLPYPNSDKNRNREQYITLYHGTSNYGGENIAQYGIDVKYGRANLDFGQGFYVTREQKQAEKWVRKNYGIGQVLVFQVKKSEMSRFKGLKFSGGTKQWSDFITKNRNKVPLHTYDYVEGPFVANPGEVADGKKPVALGDQISIHTGKMAFWLMKGYRFKYPVR